MIGAPRVGRSRQSPSRRAALTRGAPRSGSDRDFYAFPRFVKHVDDGFLAQLTQLYRQRLPPGGTLLELGASHISHLPDDVAYVSAATQRRSALRCEASAC